MLETPDRSAMPKAAASLSVVRLFMIVPPRTVVKAIVNQRAALGQPFF